ncbi:MAG: GAF domain-containing protein, partial [Pirellulales bacterium]|nr:GAF domain-containing protein [Pirellulales bacterium]
MQQDLSVEYYLDRFQKPLAVIFPDHTLISNPMLKYLQGDQEKIEPILNDFVRQQPDRGHNYITVPSDNGNTQNLPVQVERMGEAYIITAYSRGSAYNNNELQTRFRSILDISQQIASSLNPEEVIPQLAVRAQQLVLADSCTVFLLTTDGDSLVPIFTNDADNAEAVMSFPLQLGQGLTGHVAQVGEPMIVEDSSRSDLVAHVPGTADEVTSLVAVPLKHKDEVIGVMSLDRIGKDPFNRDDLELLAILGSQAASIVVHANLYNQIKKSAELYRGLFDNAMHGIFRLDLKGHFLQANPAFLYIMGYEDLESFRNWSETAPWGNADTRSEFIHRVSSEGEVKDFKCSGFNMNNDSLHLKYTARFFPANSYIEGSVEDITHEVELEDENRNRILFLERLISQNPLPMLVFSNPTRLIQINPAVSELFGPERTHSLADFHLWLQSLFPKMPDLLQELQSGQVLPRREVTLRSDQEEIILYLQGFPVQNQRQETTHLILSLENVSVERSLRQQLYHSQKMEGLGKLTSGVVHDFNNILSAILGYGSLLKSQAATPEKVKQYASTIDAASLRASRLARTLLGFARSSSLDSSAGPLRDAIRTSIQLVRHITKKAIAIEVNIDDLPDHFMVDSGRIEQVLLNLLINAVDALQDSEDPSITVNTNSCSEDCVLITVADNGNGIDPAVRERIFEPFFTTKPKGKGTGLGLSTVHSILQSLDGNIEVNSTLGSGTVFTITLPALQEEIDAALTQLEG